MNSETQRRAEDSGRETVRNALRTLTSAFEWEMAKRLEAVSTLWQCVQNDYYADIAVDEGVVPVLLKHIREYPHYEPAKINVAAQVLCQLAINKPQLQQLIMDLKVIPLLTTIFKITKERNDGNTEVLQMISKAIKAICLRDDSAKSVFRSNGVVHDFVYFLTLFQYQEMLIAITTLDFLARGDDQIRKLIIEVEGALTFLTYILFFDDMDVKMEAIRLIDNLTSGNGSYDRRYIIFSSIALRPIINALGSGDVKMQKDVLCLINKLSIHPDFPVHVAQYDALSRLIAALSSEDITIQQMALKILEKLSWDTHTKAGIVQEGALRPLLKMISTPNAIFQRRAAHIIYRVANTRDNVFKFVQQGGVYKLIKAKPILEETRTHIRTTLEEMERCITGPVLEHMIYLMTTEGGKCNVAQALAHVGRTEYQRKIFIENKGLEVLLKLVRSSSLGDRKHGLEALHALAARALAPGRVRLPSYRKEILEEKYINNKELSDVTFLIEGERFYAHKVALTNSSEVFSSMLSGDYMECDGNDVVIQDISRATFEQMIRFMYTGTIRTADLYSYLDLLRVADRYLLEDLRYLCEYYISKEITMANVNGVCELALRYNTKALLDFCVSYSLENIKETRNTVGDYPIEESLISAFSIYFRKYLQPCTPPPLPPMEESIMELFAE